MLKTSTKLIFNSLILIFIGIEVILIGHVWNLYLGNEKYLIGGVSFVVGVFIIIIAYRERKKGN